jgi:pilus assembly protein Flp/PilA
MTFPGLHSIDIARSVACFIANQRGATAIEYGLIAALIAVTIIAVVMSIGDSMKTMFYDKITNALARA